MGVVQQCQSWIQGGYAIVMCAWIGGCGLIVDPDVDSLGPEPPVCEYLSCNVCMCQPSNRPSYQLCNGDGEYDPCMCDPPPPAVPPACEASTPQAGDGD